MLGTLSPYTPLLPLSRQLSAKTRASEMCVCKQLFGEYGLRVHLSLLLSLFLSLSLSLSLSFSCSCSCFEPAGQLEKKRNALLVSDEDGDDGLRQVPETTHPFGRWKVSRGRQALEGFTARQQPED